MSDKQTVFDVAGMKCGGCVSTVQEALKSVPGVRDAKVDLGSNTASVIGDVDPQAVMRALHKAGYPASVKDG